MSQPTREQIRAGYEALRAEGFDAATIDEAMAAEGLTAQESPAKAEARARLDVVTADGDWFRRYMSGGAAAVEEFNRLTPAISE